MQTLFSTNTLKPACQARKGSLPAEEQQKYSNILSVSSSFRNKSDILQSACLAVEHPTVALNKSP